MSSRGVLVADDSAFIRAGFKRALEGGGLTVAGEAASADAAVAAAADARPAVALIAVELPGGGLDATRRITGATRATRVVVFTAHTRGDELVEAVLAGAVGYLSRDMRLERLPEIVRAVTAGETALPRRQSAYLLETLRGRESRRAIFSAQADAPLTAREWEVLQLLAEGISTGEMARRLGISAVTTRRHVSSAVAKLGVPDRESAAALMRSLP